MTFRRRVASFLTLSRVKLTGRRLTDSQTNLNLNNKGKQRTIVDSSDPVTPTTSF